MGEVAVFNIAQNFEKRVEEVAMPIKLQESLKESNLETQFNDLTPYRKKEIMKYLNKVKGIETFERNLNSLLSQLRNMERDVRIPKNK